MITNAPARPRALPARTIFVIDDDPLVLASLGALLEIETHHSVRRFQRTDEALAAMREEQPQLIISDLTMPGMDGVELLRRSIEICPDAARIILTGYADKDSAIGAINVAGIYQYIEKPWDNTQLLVTVERALEHVELTSQLGETIEELRERNAELERAMAELREAQELLVANERLAAVGRLASGIAHEIGNQLSLLSYAEVIAEHFAADPMARQLTDPIIAARRRLGSMVGSIKDFVRGAGDASYPRERHAIAPIIEECLEILRFEPAMKTRQLAREPWDAKAAAVVNRDKILQLVLNLIRNALQATGDGGNIRIGISVADKNLILEVQDDGAGITPENLSRIWDPFFSTKGEAGTGLGLGISKRIVEEHGGTIEVESRPGEGATFRVTLPAA